LLVVELRLRILVRQVYVVVAGRRRLRLGFRLRLRECICVFEEVDQGRQLVACAEEESGRQVWTGSMQDVAGCIVAFAICEDVFAGLQLFAA
jgi:hypothetical protein